MPKYWQYLDQDKPVRFPPLLYALLGGFGVVSPGTPAPSATQDQGPVQVPSLTAAQWREDLRYFARELEGRHKNVFHTVSRPDFERAVAALDSAIPSLQPHQIAVRLKQLAAMVGDGHTGVHLPAWFQVYPINLYWFGTELRVVSALPEYRSALGARVVGVGDLPIDEVQRRVATCLPSEKSENRWLVMSASPVFLTRPEVLHALGVIPSLGPARLSLEDESGKRFTLEVRPIQSPPIVNGSVAFAGLVPAAKSQPLYRQRPGESFWFTRLPDSQTVYLNFRSYRSLGEHAGKLFEFIDRHPTTRLVIDLRQNGGGDFFEGRRHLVEPIRQRSDLNVKGRLFVLVGRRTFSAAMVNAIDFRKRTNATLVGEPIGERPNSYSENDEMTLPHSRIVVSYSTRYYKFLEEDVPAVMPDVRIDPTWPEFRDGRDPVMEWVQSQAR